MSPAWECHSDLPGDYTRTLVITDPSLYTDDSLSREDTVVTVFRPNAAELEGFEAGQPVLFRGATVCCSLESAN
jgi:hypothetical protein